jgi:hypothetical protein
MTAMAIVDRADHQRGDPRAGPGAAEKAAALAGAPDSR